jgi:hypothetical protein
MFQLDMLRQPTAVLLLLLLLLLLFLPQLLSTSNLQAAAYSSRADTATMAPATSMAMLLSAGMALLAAFVCTGAGVVVVMLDGLLAAASWLSWLPQSSNRPP